MQVPQRLVPEKFQWLRSWKWLIGPPEVHSNASIIEVKDHLAVLLPEQSSRYVNSALNIPLVSTVPCISGSSVIQFTDSPRTGSVRRGGCGGYKEQCIPTLTLVYGCVFLPFVMLPALSPSSVVFLMVWMILEVQQRWLTETRQFVYCNHFRTSLYWSSHYTVFFTITCLYTSTLLHHINNNNDIIILLLKHTCKEVLVCYNLLIQCWIFTAAKGRYIE